jgi:hypothetical protein
MQESGLDISGKDRVFQGIFTSIFLHIRRVILQSVVKQTTFHKYYSTPITCITNKEISTVIPEY